MGSLNERRNSINKIAAQNEGNIIFFPQGSRDHGENAAFGYENSVVSSSIMGASEESEVASSSEKELPSHGV
jgi:hypothetical protein